MGHSIQTNATPVSLSAANELTLITALGNITVTLAVQMSAVERQNLLQQLMNLIQAQKPLTLSLQAGSPPTQGALLLPAMPVSAPTTVQNASALPPLPNIPLPPLAVGETLPAVVLPSLSQPVISIGAQTQIPNSQNMPLSPIAPLAVNEVPTLATPVVPVTPLSVPPSSAMTPPPVGNAAPVGPLSVTPAASLEIPAEVPVASPVANIAVQNAPVTVAQTVSATPVSPVVNAMPQVNVLPSVPQVSLSTAPQTPPPLAVLLQPGNEVTLRVEVVVPPSAEIGTGQGPLPGLPALAPNQIVATVSGIGTDGQLILKAGDATLFVKAQVAAPVGTNVVVTVEAAKEIPLVTLPQSAATNFSALPQAMAALAESNPQALLQMVATHLPQPTQSLPGALLFLFSAFKQGDVSGWLGQSATDSLMRAGKMDIVASLSRELSGAGQTAQDGVVGEWNTYPIPLYSGQQFHALTLYVHSDRDARKDQSSGATPGVGKIRFLIDMRLSKLGAMQIDGFVQPKKLDMVLRSEAILPEGLHNELRTSYIKALDAVGYTGALNFQVGRQHWMMMQKAAERGIVT